MAARITKLGTSTTYLATNGPNEMMWEVHREPDGEVSQVVCIGGSPTGENILLPVDRVRELLGIMAADDYSHK
jgi:hypothetical protein